MSELNLPTQDGNPFEENVTVSKDSISSAIELSTENKLKSVKVEQMKTPDENSSKITSNNGLSSKRQLKKLRKLKEWEEKKKEKRLKEREKQKKRKEDALAKGLPTRTGPSRKELKRNKSTESKNFLKVAVDLDFDDLMIDKDISKCVKQLLRMYTINRRSLQPAQLLFTGIKTGGKIHDSLERNDGYQNWDVKWHFDHYINILEKEKIMYLTSDSDGILEELDESTIYVIGGLVDHNHHKGLCYKRAEDLGIRTARLPLQKYVDMKTRTVLSTYHVFEILLKRSEGKTWSEAILETLPMRKGAKPRVEKMDKVDKITENTPS